MNCFQNSPTKIGHIHIFLHWQMDKMYTYSQPIHLSSAFKKKIHLSCLTEKTILQGISFCKLGLDFDKFLYYIPESHLHIIIPFFIVYTKKIKQSDLKNNYYKVG